MDQQPILIDEVRFHQRLDKGRAAEQENVTSGLLFQLRDFARDVPFDNGRIVPFSYCGVAVQSGTRKESSDRSQWHVRRANTWGRF
jgi:hypothetical protein